MRRYLVVPPAGLDQRLSEMLSQSWPRANLLSIAVLTVELVGSRSSEFSCPIPGVLQGVRPTRATPISKVFSLKAASWHEPLGRRAATPGVHPVQFSIRIDFRLPQGLNDGLQGPR